MLALPPWLAWATLALGSGRKDPDAPPVLGHAHQVLFDEDRREIGVATFAAHGAWEGDALRFHVQVDARSRLEVLEAVVAVDELRHGPPLPAADRAVVTSAWNLQTGRGHGYWAVTTASCDQVDAGVEVSATGCARVDRKAVAPASVRMQVKSAE